MAKAKILLVEDDRIQAKFVTDFLEKKGYEVLYSGDGKSAIKIAKTEPIDLIILDLILPDISGYEVSRWLKINNDTKGIPIIMLTARSTLNDKIAGLEAGADDYLPKPFDEAELNARIYASLRTKALQDELRERNRQLEELLAKVELMAITDPLTEINNRRRFEEVIKKEFSCFKRYHTPLTCMMIDIDHFKRINDRYGHAQGDSVLKETALLICRNLREVDTLARWGGEEFIALLPQTDKNEALNVARRILENIRNHRFQGIPPHETITVSIGISGIPSDNIENWERLIMKADQALYMAKENGRDMVEII